MRLVVLGAAGQVGSAVVRGAAPGGLEGAPFAPGVDAVAALTRAELDVTDARAVRAVVADQVAAGGPRTVVLNATGWTDVDGAEADEPGAYRLNAAAPGLLAAACAAHDVPLLHLSTDYVFNGRRPPDGPPWGADEPTGPLSAYGRTKLAGEQAVRALHPTGGHVVRTAWVWAPPGEPHPNFVATMTRLATERDTVDVVDDQVGSPTATPDLAAGLLALAAAAADRRVPAGVRHATNAGSTSWYGLARAVFRALGHDPDRVRPTTTAAYPRPAPRPAYSVLDPTGWLAAGLPAFRPWEVALTAVLG